MNGVLAYRPAVPVSELLPIWVSRDGNRELLDESIRGVYNAPAISPDGRKVALEFMPPVGRPEIWIYDLEQRTFERVTSEGSSRRPFWSSDGRELGFTSDRDGEFAAYAQAADFSGEARLLRTAPDVPVQEALWTPDGEWLVYRQGSAAAPALYYARPHPDSTANLMVEGEGAALFAPAVSYDGRWLAYASAESGRREVYVRPFPGAGARQRVSREGGRDPVWGRDGQSLYYRDAGGSWVELRVRLEPEFTIESRMEFAYWQGVEGGFTTQQFDVTPDGERLLALRRQVSEVAEFRDIIVQDFFSVLREVVGN